MNTQPVEQYRTELTLNGHVTGNKEAEITITTQDQNTTKKIVSNMLGDETHFEQQKNGSLFIYHPSIRNGKEPCGWSSQVLVPSGFDVKNTTEYRFELQRVAA